MVNPVSSSDRTDPLGLNELHVWSVSLAAATLTEKELRTLVSPEEWNRADRFFFAPDRHRFLLRRAALRALLAGYLGRPMLELSFAFGPCGKPAITPALNSQDIRFNCSHSRDCALFAFSRGRDVGIDVAWHDPAVSPPELCQAILSPREQSAWSQLPPALARSAFFDAWTRKEAYVKAIGHGLSFSLDRFSVSLAPDHPALVEVASAPREVSRWTLATLDVGPDYSATVAYESPPIPIRLSSFALRW